MPGSPVEARARLAQGGAVVPAAMGRGDAAEEASALLRLLEVLSVVTNLERGLKKRGRKRYLRNMARTNTHTHTHTHKHTHKHTHIHTRARARAH